MSEAPTEGLSDNSKDVLSRYFAWAKKQQSIHMKDIEGEAAEFRAASLVDDSYNKQDVKDQLNSLTTILKITIENEQRDRLNSVGELLRQALLCADKAGAPIEMDLAALGDPALGNLGAAFSGASLLKKTNLLAPAAKLPDLKPAEQQAPSEDLIKLKDEKDKLKEEKDKVADKLQKVQAQYTLMMQEKSKLTQEVNKLRDAALAGDAALLAKAAEMQAEVEALKTQLEKKDAELSESVKNPQKQNMEALRKFAPKILQQKNQQIKALKASLLKYEPEGTTIDLESESDDEETVERFT